MGIRKRQTLERPFLFEQLNIMERVLSTTTRKCSSPLIVLFRNNRLISQCQHFNALVILGIRKKSLWLEHGFNQRNVENWFIFEASKTIACCYQFNQSLFENRLTAIVIYVFTRISKKPNKGGSCILVYLICEGVVILNYEPILIEAYWFWSSKAVTMNEFRRYTFC